MGGSFFMKIECKSCGHPIEVTPSDKDHTIVLSDPPPRSGANTANVQYEKCLAWETEIYWS
jgi:hypothetical protein